MLSPGDGIAIAGVCAVAIGAVAKFAPGRKFDTNGWHKIFVGKELCQTKVNSFNIELKRIEKQLDDLNKFLRENGK